MVPFFVGQSMLEKLAGHKSLIWRWQSMISADTFSTNQLHMSHGNPGHVSSQSSKTVLSQGCWSISLNFSVDSKNLNEKATTLAQPKWLGLMNAMYWPTNTLCIFLAHLEKVQKKYIYTYLGIQGFQSERHWCSVRLSREQIHSCCQRVSGTKAFCRVPLNT